MCVVFLFFVLYSYFVSFFLFFFFSSTAYTKHNSKLFERILGDSKVNLLSDPFLAEYVDDLLQKTRQLILIDFVRPYL